MATAGHTIHQQTVTLESEIFDRVKVLRPTRHNIVHFGDVLPRQSLGLELKNSGVAGPFAAWCGGQNCRPIV